MAIKTIDSSIRNEFLSNLHGLERKGSCAEAKEKETISAHQGNKIHNHNVKNACLLRKPTSISCPRSLCAKVSENENTPPYPFEELLAKYFLVNKLQVASFKVVFI